MAAGAYRVTGTQRPVDVDSARRLNAGTITSAGCKCASVACSVTEPQFETTWKLPLVADNGYVTHRKMGALCTKTWIFSVAMSSERSTSCERILLVISNSSYFVES